MLKFTEKQLIVSEYTPPPHTHTHQKLFIDYKGRLWRQHLNQVIRVTITNNGTKQHHVPINGMLREEWSLGIFAPNAHLH